MNATSLDYETYSRLQKLEDAVEKLEAENRRLRNGLIQIIQMERFPTESGSDFLDGIYPTGSFAVKVLSGEWPK